MIVAGVGVLLWDPAARPISAPYEVPSLTAWGKVFALLLLAALGVAYLVWRRPVVQAQAILETSPLGGEERAAPLVDWALYIKVLLITDLPALAGVWGLRVSGILVLGRVDTLGILTSGAIVAFVVHLLLLSRRRGRGTPPKR